MSLRSTIHEIQTRDSELDAIATDREEFLAGWRRDIGTLYSRIKELLDDYVVDGSIKFSTSKKALKESSIGEYDVSELRISIASRLVVASPIARLTAGGTGRVDLYRHDRPGETDRILLIRSMAASSEDSWLIERRSAGDANPLARLGLSTTSLVSGILGAAHKNYFVLEKEALEDALDYLLRI